MPPADADLLLDYLAGRLSGPEAASVEALIKADPSFADALIRLARDEGAMTEWAAVRPVAPTAVPAPPAPVSRRPVFAWATVAAVLLVGGLAAFVAVRQPVVILEAADESPARVVAVRGEANLWTADGPVPVTVGQVIRPGDRVQTGADGVAVVALPDAARVELLALTDARILSRTADAQVTVERGSVRTATPDDAEPMTVRTPHAIIRAAAALLSVVETATTVVSSDDRTRLTRMRDSQSVAVAAGRTATTDPGGNAPMLRPMPVE